jgi:hypothetical protein
MRKTIRHRFGVDQTRWWPDVFLTSSYQEALHRKGLGCVDCSIDEIVVDAQGRTHIALWTEPRVNAPPIVRKVIGERLKYREEGIYDPATGRYQFRVIPSTLANASDITGTLWIEPVGRGQIERVCELQCKINVFGVGRIVEAFVGRSYEKDISKAAEFTQQWLTTEYFGGHIPQETPRLDRVAGSSFR